MSDEKQADAAEALREARALIDHLAPNPHSWGSDMDRKAAVAAKIAAALSAASAPADGLGPLPATGIERAWAERDAAVADLEAHAEAEVRRAVAAERERCAKLCEAQLDEPASQEWNMAVKRCVAVLRA